MSSTRQLIFALTGVVATAVVGYAVWFDYKRRSSPEFRKQLKKRSQDQQKQADKLAHELKKLKLELVKKALLEDLAANPVPTELSEKEQFFMQQVALGEQLATKPALKVDAAICFYKALSVYPNPTDILGIYQRSVPEDVYEIIVMMIAAHPPAAINNILGSEAAPAAATVSASAEDLD